ncbi:MAG TPA: glycosyltransferase [Caulobacteraceae bacterium]|nr:glycosyltransferase [Caulobacteraceae bacterium]
MDDTGEQREFVPRPRGVSGQAITTSKVSVVIPCFNAERYLSACLESVLEQDHDNLQVILVDDGSTDASLRIAQGFQERDERIAVTKPRANGGAGAARNVGVGMATGDYLLFLDSDDVLAGRDAIASLVDVARRTGSRLVAGACQRLLPDGRLEAYDLLEARGCRNESGGAAKGAAAFLAGFGFRDEYFLPSRCWGALIERGFYQETALDFPEVEHEDLALMPFLYFLAGEVEYVSHVVVNYRDRPDSISNAPWSEAQVRRHLALWTCIRDRTRGLGLDAYLGDVAVTLIDHLIWRLKSNNTDAHRGAVAEICAAILADVTPLTRPNRLGPMIDALTGFALSTAQRTLDSRETELAARAEELRAREVEVGNRDLAIRAREVEVGNRDLAVRAREVELREREAAAQQARDAQLERALAQLVGLENTVSGLAEQLRLHDTRWRRRWEKVANSLSWRR